MSPLPSGQYERNDFPRFGLAPFAYRFPEETTSVRLEIDGDVESPVTVTDALTRLPRIAQRSDFHCVTTWSCLGLAWSGFRFSDLHEQVVSPQARPHAAAATVVLRGQDGYRTHLPLEDLLAPDVLLADRLDGAPLTVEHGAPLRLVAPAHYGYKSVKHICRIELRTNLDGYRSAGPRFMGHPRARVALEERGLGLPGWLFRYLYRPLVRPTVSRFRRAMASYEGDPGPG